MKKRTYIPVELIRYATDDFTTDPASEGARPVVCLTAFIITLKVVQHGKVNCVLHHNIENNLFSNGNDIFVIFFFFFLGLWLVKLFKVRIIYLYRAVESARNNVILISLHPIMNSNSSSVEVSGKY